MILICITISVSALACLVLLLSFDFSFKKHKKGHYVDLTSLLKHNLQIAFTKRLQGKNAISAKESKLIREHIDKKYVSKKGENNAKG